MLGQPALARVVQRLRDRLARSSELAQPLRLPRATEAEREAIGKILGRPPGRGASLTVSLMTLEQTLRAGGIAPSLIGALEALGGPLIDPRDSAARESEAWLAATTQVHRWTATQANPERRTRLSSWLEAIVAEGLHKRLASTPDGAAALLASALAVIEALPAPRWTLAELAARTTGDAHGLDPERPLATLVQRAAAALSGLEETTAGSDAAARRRQWERVGISVDALGSSVLVFGLRGAGDGLVDQVLALHADAREPLRLTEQALVAHAPRLSRDTVGPLVFVCENPAVVAAASRHFCALDRSSTPLVCTEGQPSTAARLLLEALRAAGVMIAAHADFDVAGQQIVALLGERHGALKWRFDSASYLEALAAAREARLTELPPSPGASDPSGRRAAAESQLSASIAAAGVAIHEELVIDTLLADLDASAIDERASMPRHTMLPPHVERLGRRCPRAAWLAVYRPQASPGDRERAATTSNAVAEMFDQHAREVARRYRVVTSSLESTSPASAPLELRRIRAALHVDREEEIETLAARWHDAFAAGSRYERATLVTLGPGCPLATDRVERAGFRAEEVTGDVEPRSRLVAGRRAAVAALLARPDEPAVPLGPWCRHRDARDACPFVDHCFAAAAVPTPSILDLPRGGERAWSLYRRGLVRLESVDEAQVRELGSVQQRFVRAALARALVVDEAALLALLATWKPPLTFLDLETFCPPLSELSGLPPFAHLVFAAALATEGDEHPAVVLSTAVDPRPDVAAWLATRLSSTHAAGSIVAYNAPFEAARLAELARACPAHAPVLLDARQRLVDARQAVEDTVSHPALHRLDLKTVTSTLVPPWNDSAAQIDPDVEALGDGLSAAAAYERLRRGTQADLPALRRCLERYVTSDVERLRHLHAWLSTRRSAA